MITTLMLALLACGDSTPTEPVEKATAHEEPMEEAKEAADEGAPKHASLFGVLPEHMYDGEKASPEMVSLGRQLYYDTRLSKNHDISCNSCHKLDAYGVDNEPRSPGHKGQLGGRNSPTSYNAALHVSQFWDGRAATVEEQAMGPMTNPVEMAMKDGPAVDTVLKSIPGYVEQFEKVFPDDEQPVTIKNAAVAIGAFERGLVTANSPFDKYLKGDASALTDEQKAGLDLFVETGCTACHTGPTMGGTMYQKLGMVKPYETEDVGRKEVTGKDADLMMFKVPSLRNIDKTGPYFHDGSVATLEEAVKLMAWHQLGKELDEGQIAKIVAFLKSTTGEIPTDYIAKPELPESGPNTPAADPS